MITFITKAAFDRTN